MAAGDRHHSNGTVEATAPTGGYTKGLFYQLSGGGYAVALETVAASATCLMLTDGDVEVTKETDTGETFEVGDQVFVASSGKASAEATSNTALHCIAIEAVAAAATTTVKVRLQASVADD